MKIQYLGFLPLIILVLVSHWRLIRFYWKYKTFEYFADQVPSSDDPIWALIVCSVFWISIVVGGVFWGAS